MCLHSKGPNPALTFFMFHTRPFEFFLRSDAKKYPCSPRGHDESGVQADQCHPQLKLFPLMMLTQLPSGQ